MRTQPVSVAATIWCKLTRFIIKTHLCSPFSRAERPKLPYLNSRTEMATPSRATLQKAMWPHLFATCRVTFPIPILHRASPVQLPASTAFSAQHLLLMTDYFLFLLLLVCGLIFKINNESLHHVFRHMTPDYYTSSL